VQITSKFEVGDTGYFSGSIVLQGVLEVDLTASNYNFLAV